MTGRSRHHLLGAILAASVSLSGTFAMAAQQLSLADAMSILGRSGRSGETLVQYLERRMAQFRSLDLDGDGAVTAADLALRSQLVEAGARASSLSQILMLDLDGDGTITRAEVETFFSIQLTVAPAPIKAQLPAAVDKAMAPDMNGDGRIDAQEMLAYADKHAIRSLTPGVVSSVLLFDEDKDGRTTREEYRKAAEAAFRAVDSNGDGVLTKDELDAYRHATWKAPGRP